jgi:hypothetical protein
MFMVGKKGNFIYDTIFIVVESRNMPKRRTNLSGVG